MKTQKTFGRIILSTGAAILMAATASMPLTTGAADQAKPMKPMKGGEHLLMLNEVKTKQDLDALKADDTIAMVCSKCKTVWTTRAKQGMKGGQVLTEGSQSKEIIGTHGCRGCNSELTVVGVQKGAHTELKHSCKACGDDSAFCCATKSGSSSTSGHEH